MAIQRNQVNNTTTTENNNNGGYNNGQQRQRKEADGWLNIQVKTASGEWISVRATIALDKDNNVHQGMLNKAKADPSFEFEIKGTIGVKSTEIPEF